MTNSQTGNMLSISGVDKFYGPIDRGVHAVKKLSMDIEKVRSSLCSDLPAVARHRLCA